MTKVERQFVRDCIENEGFHYTFVHYSDFKNVKDKEFQKLRQAYINAAADLNAFVNPEDENGR